MEDTRHLTLSNPDRAFKMYGRANIWKSRRLYCAPGIFALFNVLLCHRSPRGLWCSAIFHVVLFYQKKKKRAKPLCFLSLALPPSPKLPDCWGRASQSSQSHLVESGARLLESATDHCIVYAFTWPWLCLPPPQRRVIGYEAAWSKNSHGPWILVSPNVWTN